MNEPRDQGRNGHYGEVDEYRTQMMREDGLLPPEAPWPTSPQPTAVARVIATEMLKQALVALGTLAKVWPVDRQLDPTRDSSLIVQFAHCVFDEVKQVQSLGSSSMSVDSDDSSDLRDALDKFMRGMLRATEKQHGCSSKEKQDILEDIIGRLELIMGVAYSPTADLVRTQALDLNKAGAGFAGVRPEDVNENLRRVTFDFWVKKHTEMANAHRAETGVAQFNRGGYSTSFRDHVVNGSPTNDGIRVGGAVQMVNDAIRDGAFIRPFAEMPEGQQQFWLQRALGVELFSVLSRSRRQRIAYE